MVGAFGGCGGFIYPSFILSPIGELGGRSQALSLLVFTILSLVCLLLNYKLDKKMKDEENEDMYKVVCWSILKDNNTLLR